MRAYSILYEDTACTILCVPRAIFIVRQGRWQTGILNENINRPTRCRWRSKCRALVTSVTAAGPLGYRGPGPAHGARPSSTRRPVHRTRSLPPRPGCIDLSIGKVPFPPTACRTRFRRCRPPLRCSSFGVSDVYLEVPLLRSFGPIRNYSFLCLCHWCRLHHVIIIFIVQYIIFIIYYNIICNHGLGIVTLNHIYFWFTYKL